jgi:hypothetical protein
MCLRFVFLLTTSVFVQVTGITLDPAGCIRSRCVSSGPAVARTHDGRGLAWVMPGFVGQRGAGAGMQGPVDVLAGDLAVARQAESAGGQQDVDAVPGAGGDFGGRAREASHSDSAAWRRSYGRSGGVAGMATAVPWRQMRL